MPGLQEAVLHPYLCAGFDDFVFLSAPRYYRGADTREQAHNDAFTSAGVEMLRTSPPDAPRSATAAFGPVFRHLVTRWRRRYARSPTAAIR